MIERRSPITNGHSPFFGSTLNSKSDCFAKTAPPLNDLLIIDTEPVSQLYTYDPNIKPGIYQINDSLNKLALIKKLFTRSIIMKHKNKKGEIRRFRLFAISLATQIANQFFSIR